RGRFALRRSRPPARRDRLKCRENGQVTIVSRGENCMFARPPGGARSSRRRRSWAEARGSMADTVTTSLDVMGGDLGPMQVLPGADIALTRRPDIRYRLFGDEKVVRPILDRFPRVRDASIFEHTDYSVRMDEKPSQALRQGRRRSSMWRTV